MEVDNIMPYEKKDPAVIAAEMDAAAVEAQNDLVNVDPEAIEKVRVWWEKWFKKAGHKRLGRILVKGI